MSKVFSMMCREVKLLSLGHEALSRSGSETLVLSMVFELVEKFTKTVF